MSSGGGVCIILHLSACTGVNTSVVWSEVENGSSTAYECSVASLIIESAPRFPLL